MLDGQNVSALMGAIAKGLVGASSTGAPKITFPCFHIDGVRRFLGDHNVSHNDSSTRLGLCYLDEFMIHKP
jgi:hypothetical protein